jgi:hypothetical protein
MLTLEQVELVLEQFGSDLGNVSIADIMKSMEMAQTPILESYDE